LPKKEKKERLLYHSGLIRCGKATSLLQSNLIDQNRVDVEEAPDGVQLAIPHSFLNHPILEGYRFKAADWACSKTSIRVVCSLS
jgi:hypothetical protein